MFRTATKTLAVIAACSPALLAGCYNGSIEIKFTVPDIDTDVETLRIIVYAEAAGAINCNALSFGEIPSDVLDTTEVFDGQAPRGEVIRVSGIPRVGKKLFFAEGFSATGISVVAGCSEAGDIEGPTLVEIEGAPRTNAEVDSELVVRANPDGSGGGRVGDVEVSVVTLEGRPSPTPIRWTLQGAAKDGPYESSGDEQTNSSGRVTIAFADAQPDALPGPLALDVRSQWAQSQTPPLVGFLDPVPAFHPVSLRDDQLGTTRGNDILEVARLGPPGTSTLSIVILATEAPAAGREATEAHVFELRDDVLVEVDSIGVGDTAATRARTLGKIAHPTFDQLIAVWRDDSDVNRWTDIGLGQTIESPYSGLPGKLGAIAGCDDGDEQVLVAQMLVDQRRLETASAAGVLRDSVGLGANLEVVEIGCVRDTLDNFRTVLVLAPPGLSSALFAPYSPGLAVLIEAPGGLQVFEGTVDVDATTAWIGDFNSSADGALILGERTLDGPATTRYLLQPTGPNTVAADFVGQDPTPAATIFTAEGDINGDGQSDVVSLLATGSGDGKLEVRVHVSMAIAGSPKRLRATMDLPIQASSPRLRLGDLDGNGADDIIVGSPDGLRVFLMGQR